MPPTLAPSQSPSLPPTAAPSTSPSTHPTASPSDHPTSFPTESPSSNPTNVPSGDPTVAPTNSPTTAPTEIAVSRTIYFFYNQDIDDIFSLSLSRYNDELIKATQQAIIMMMNDTSIDSVCNRSDSDGVDCELSNYNSFTSRRRRRGLNIDYSYNNDIDNGWWQGRIENLQYCVLFDNLVWNPNDCQTYDESIFQDAEEVNTQQAEYIVCHLCGDKIILFVCMHQCVLIVVAINLLGIWNF